jgi:predicted aldo/keto reductase-like oxidoreductase
VVEEFSDRYDMTEYAKMRYNLLGSGGDWFPGNKADQVDKLNLQQCLIRSPHADKIPHLLAQAHQMLGGEAVKRLSQK